jgi:DNA-binding CsgD family transcriptional regulator
MRRGDIDPMSVVLASAEATSFQELAETITDRVAALVGAWGSLLYRYEAGRIVPLGGRLAPPLVDYRAEHVPTDPTQIRARSLAPRPRVVLATRSVGRRAFERCAAYSDFYQKYDVERVTCMWLNDRPYATEGMVGMLLARDRRGEEFGDRDGDRLGDVLSALVVAVQRCARVEALRWNEQGLEAAAEVIGAYVVIDAAGGTVWISRPARSLLGAELPDALVTAARRLLAADGGARVELDLAIAGVAARAELQVSGPPERRVVVARLEPRGRDVDERTAARLRERFGLTAAETRVLRLVALGLTNATIAERCEVSIETIRTHVARVLAKLDVATRAQAGVVVWSFESDG